VDRAALDRLIAATRADIAAMAAALADAITAGRAPVGQAARAA
jgi:hypothetical protein